MSVCDAAFWDTAEGGAVRCRLCPHECLIPEGRHGICRVRANRSGRLVSLNYGRVAARAVEPLEKKPLYHFHPGGRVLTLGPYGCNLRCAFCQNWTISQRVEPGEPLSPDAAVAEACDARHADARVVGIGFSYSEPIMWFEHVRDVAELARAEGLLVVLKTAGYVESGPLEALLGWVDALNVDVKSFREAYYRRVCGGRLGPVRRTVESAVRAGRHVEVTYLLVPGVNDDPSEVDELAAWLAEIDPHIPLHLPRFYPNWKLGGAPASDELLSDRRAVAARRLSYVYVGGTWRAEHASTVCPGCRSVLVRRDGLVARAVGLRGDACATCGRPADFVGGFHAGEVRSCLG